MCGRYTLFSSAHKLAKEFELEEQDSAGWVEGVVPRYNITPGGGILNIRHDPDRDRRLADYFLWGLVPGWTKEDKLSSRLINARVETATEKPSFRDATRYRRCLIPASGWFEWKRSGSHLQPFYFYRGKPDTHSFMAFAGLWEYWQHANGSEIFSACVLTANAVDEIGKIHHRMPVILGKSDWEAWLNPRHPGYSDWEGIQQRRITQGINFHPVSEKVQQTRNDEKSLIAPVLEKQDPQLSLGF